VVMVVTGITRATAVVVVAVVVVVVVDTCTRMVPTTQGEQVGLLRDLQLLRQRLKQQGHSLQIRCSDIGCSGSVAVEPRGLDGLCQRYELGVERWLKRLRMTTTASVSASAAAGRARAQAALLLNRAHTCAVSVSDASSWASSDGCSACMHHQHHC
jgi:hypothetical protein